LWHFISYINYQTQRLIEAVIKCDGKMEGKMSRKGILKKVSSFTARLAHSINNYDQAKERL
jgi:hypothetical protein